MKLGFCISGCTFERADAEVLLSHILKRDRSWIFSHGEYELTTEEEEQWNEWKERRQKSEPVAYILGEQEFYGRVFSVDRRVLIPRPSTEVLVSEALRLLSGGEARETEADSGIVIRSSLKGDISDVKTVVDIGTGSGCIAVTLALERPDLRIIATDVSSDALDVARSNAARHSVSNRIEFRNGSLLRPVEDVQEPFLVVSNLPYIPTERTLSASVQQYEPHGALFSGFTGSEFIEKQIHECEKHPSCRGYCMEMEQQFS